VLTSRPRRPCLFALTSRRRLSLSPVASPWQRLRGLIRPKPPEVGDAAMTTTKPPEVGDATTTTTAAPMEDGDATTTTASVEEDGDEPSSNGTLPGSTEPATVKTEMLA